MFLSLLLSSCAEKVNISIVSPPSNFRITDPYTEGATFPQPVSVYYEGSQQQKIAIIKNINTGETYPCTLTSGKDNICGSTLITKLGAQSIQVFVAKNNKEIVTEIATFRWEPYQGLEKIAYEFSGNFGDKSMPWGMFYIAAISFITVFVVALVIVLSKGYVVRQKDSVKLTLIDERGRKIVYEEDRGAFAGLGNLDQPRPRMEPQNFRGAVNLLYAPDDAKRILLAQPDSHLMLDSGEDVIDVEATPVQKKNAYYGPYSA